MEVIGGLIILVLDVIALISILNSHYTPIKKLLWMLVILFLPILGLILWYLLGNPGKVQVEIKTDNDN